jgi:DNA adenine methylase
MESIISRVGGKSKLAKIIVDKIPNHKTYIEPFIGGGAVYFRKEPGELDVINDLDKDIFTIYKDMKKVGDKMKNKNFFPNRNLFNKLKSQNKFRSEEERLYRNLYLSLNSFRSDRKNFVGEKKVEDRRGQDVGKKYKTDKYKDRLKNTKIFNKDYKTIIKDYDNIDSFFYLDPPYSRAEEVGDYNFNTVDLNELHDILKNIKGKFLLSYDDIPEIKKIFKDFKIKKIKTKYETSKKPFDVNELLISNF